MSSQYLKENPDSKNPNYSSKNGVYEEGCGLNNVAMSWGHDDYMYLVSLIINFDTHCFFSKGNNFF